MSQRTDLPEKLTVVQLLIQFPVFYRTCGFITLFTTAPLTPSHPIPLAHPSGVLTYIFFTAQHHYYSPYVYFTSNTILTQQNGGQKSETMTNKGMPNLIK